MCADPNPTREVYNSGKKYDSVTKLKADIEEKWYY